MTFEETIHSLSNLKDTELHEVQARTSFLLNGSTTKASDGDIEAMYDAIIVQLKILHKSCPPFQVFTRSNFYPQFIRNTESIMRFIDENFDCEKRISRLAMIRFLILMLIRNLDNQSLPLRIGVITTNLSRIPDIVDRAFPGYLESGLLDKVVKSVVRQ